MCDLGGLMVVFVYKVINVKGKNISGVLEGDNVC